MAWVTSWTLQWPDRAYWQAAISTSGVITFSTVAPQQQGRPAKGGQWAAREIMRRHRASLRNVHVFRRRRRC